MRITLCISQSKPREGGEGGGGLNVARAVGRLGGEATAVWTSGGLTGEILRGLLDGEGVPHRPIPIAGMTRENLIVSETGSGQQYRFNMPGAEIRRAEVDACIRSVREADPPP